MNETLMELRKIFNDGISYEDYVNGTDEESKAKHLHYREKMALTEEEKRWVDQRAFGGDFLVFCETTCNDCRIVTAILEQIQSYQPAFRIRYVLRPDHENLMGQIQHPIKIPMVIQLNKDHWKLVFYEIPKTLSQKGDRQSEEERQQSRLDFQRGLWKEEVLREFLENIS